MHVYDYVFNSPSWNHLMQYNVNIGVYIFPKCFKFFSQDKDADANSFRRTGSPAHNH